MKLVKASQDHPRHITPRVEENVVKISASIAKIVVYNGSYSVLPRGDTETVLKTQGMQMKENVTVKKVPRYVASGLSGGTTVYIGGEYDGNF